jgi:hypothetical protein
MASNSELIGDEAATEEVLRPEAIAVSSSMERVLDVVVGTTVLRVGSDRNGGGRWWRSLASRAEVKTRQCGCDRRQSGARFLW